MSRAAISAVGGIHAKRDMSQCVNYGFHRPHIYDHEREVTFHKDSDSSGVVGCRYLNGIRQYACRYVSGAPWLVSVDAMAVALIVCVECTSVALIVRCFDLTKPVGYVAFGLTKHEKFPSGSECFRKRTYVRRILPSDEYCVVFLIMAAFRARLFGICASL